MAHALQLFVARPVVLRPFLRAAPAARLYRLRPESAFAVLPLDEDTHDALHASYGTGDWLTAGARITTTDMAFAARASQSGGLAYVETEYFGGVGEQSAALWQGGSLVLGPLRLDSTGSEGRPLALRPVNTALRGLGVSSDGFVDAFEALGLGDYRSNAAIISQAQAVAAG